MKKNSGFSLIEIVIVIIVLSVVSLIAAKILTEGARSYSTSADLISANWQSRFPLERMVRDIQAVRSPTDITTASAGTFTFTDTSGTSDTYTTSGSTLTLNGNALGDGINSLAFSYFDSTGAVTATLANIRYVTITLNVTQGNANFTVITSVYPRNLR